MSYLKNRKSKYSEEFKDKCKEMYLMELTAVEVAKKMGCSGASVVRWNRKAGISRTGSEAAKLRGYSEGLKDECRKMYLVGMTTIEVAKKVGCSRGSVAQWNQEAGISRTRSKAAKLASKNAKRNYNEEFKDRCKEMYLTGLTSIEIAKKMGCAVTSVARWIKEEGITRARKGSNSPNWKGGATPRAQRLRGSQKMIDWRDEVYKRDDYTCRICDRRSGSLNAHHTSITIQYMMENFETLEDCFDYKPFWKLDNGITLCEDCHKKVHSGKLILKISPQAQKLAEDKKRQ